MKRLTIPALALVILAAAPRPSLADDEGVTTESYPKLQLYGFADMNYRVSLIKDTNKWWGNAVHSGTATIGNLNLYLDSKISPQVRSLIEVRYTYAPNGSLTQPDGKGGTVKGNTVVTDYGNAYSSSFSWGGVDIERAWVEYHVTDLFTARVGEFLTPYGVWNVDHGSSVLIGTKPPYIVAQEWFPRHQMGAELYGTRYLGNLRAGYHLTISNGRIGNNSETVHTNGSPGLGGRVFLEGENFGEWRVGFSNFNGKYTEKSTGTPAGGKSITTITNEYDGNVFGADLNWKYRKLHVVVEGIFSTLNYNAKEVATKDLFRYGGYGIVAYELPWGFTPWVQYDASRASNHSEQILNAVKLGIDKQLAPGLVVKVAVNRVWYEHSTNKDKFDEFTSQAAWAF